MVPLIRKNAPNSVIIVGTAGYSQDVDDAALNPLAYPNIMYAMHFYAGTHGQYLRDKTAKALKKIAIFSTEWGTSVADGGKDMVVYKAETRTWLDFLDANKISWCNWQLCDQAGESSSIIDPSQPWEGKRLNERLSESGAFVRDEILRGK
jgi:endoglucanase